MSATDRTTDNETDETGPDETVSDEPENDGTDATGVTSRGDRLVDRWAALDRGWQALLLGVAIVVVLHLVGSL